MYAASALLAIIALGWAADRALGIALPVDSLVDWIVVWPRSLFLAGLLTVFAGAVLYGERGRNRLLPVAEKAAVSD